MSSDNVFLNVGGTVFQTTRSTLTSVDGFFARLWSQGSNWAESSEGAGTRENPLFIDRDPLAFPGILSYLRTRKAILGADDTVYLQKLAVEADFYMLEGLVSAVAQELTHRATLPSAAPPRWQYKMLEVICEDRETGASITEVDGLFEQGWEFVQQFTVQMCLPFIVLRKMV